MDYYHFVRREIEPLLPKTPRRILEVGAGAGSTLRWLKTLHSNVETTGVEINPALRVELQRNADVAIIGPIEETLSRLTTYDLILLLDVLEHLHDSLGMLKKIIKLLEPQGCVIVSVPNIAHLSVSLPLLLLRRFDYRDAGILDRTHRLSGGLLRHHLARQYIMRGELNNQEISQPRIRWMVAE